ncbi:MAG: gas vesicle protein [Deltaproteobacteria bacterium]|nr:gas vesicle protein [Deltaproteobacteria bacterium]
MKPTGASKVSLSEVIDRLLDKGLVINADVVITVAGIPLVAVSLIAAVAGMETMLEYGVMEDWDKSVRGLGMEDACQKQ